MRIPNRFSILSLASVGVLGLMLALPPAHADEGRRQCRREAKHNFRECHANCKEDFQLGKDACLDRDHDCVEACRVGRHICREPIVADLRVALERCEATKDAAVATCKLEFAKDTPERDACIDQAQGVAFACRDTAREAAEPGLRICRRAFRGCASQCSPNDPPDPTGVRQCVEDVKEDFDECKAACVEGFQADKDTCLNRDHECVEACRADRRVCRQPLIDALGQAIDACNATREAAETNCRNLYGAGTPERDACIDQAQLDAFQCRDDARENAHPGLKVCSDAFEACAEACPPPPPPA